MYNWNEVLAEAERIKDSVRLDIPPVMAMEDVKMEEDYGHAK